MNSASCAISFRYSFRLPPLSITDSIPYSSSLKSLEGVLCATYFMDCVMSSPKTFTLRTMFFDSSETSPYSLNSASISKHFTGGTPADAMAAMWLMAKGRLVLMFSAFWWTFWNGYM